MVPPSERNRRITQDRKGNIPPSERYKRSQQEKRYRDSRKSAAWYDGILNRVKDPDWWKYGDDGKAFWADDYGDLGSDLKDAGNSIKDGAENVLKFGLPSIGAIAISAAVIYALFKLK